MLTAEDLPLKGGSGRAAEPLAREEIVWSGQPVALVVAESEAAAEDGAALVWVDAEPLPPVMDLEAALQPDAPAARLTAQAGADDGAADAHGGGPASDGAEHHDDGPNVAVRTRLQNGDVEAGFASSDVIVKGRFRTNWVHQAYLEPQSTLAWTEPDGALVVHSSTQGAFMVRQGLSSLLGLPLDRIRVQAAPIGGAFGGKLMISEPLAAAAAMALKRPVRLVFQRSEEFAAANPAPGQLIDLELGATTDRRPHRHPRPHHRRPRRHGGHGRRGHLDDALRRPVPLARARPDRARRVHQPRQPRRLPRTRRAARRVRRSRPCSTRSPSSSASTRSSSASRTSSSPATRASTARS